MRFFSMTITLALAGARRATPVDSMHEAEHWHVSDSNVEDGVIEGKGLPIPERDSKRPKTKWIDNLDPPDDENASRWRPFVVTSIGAECPPGSHDVWKRRLCRQVLSGIRKESLKLTDLNLKRDKLLPNGCWWDDEEYHFQRTWSGQMPVVDNEISKVCLVRPENVTGMITRFNTSHGPFSFPEAQVQGDLSDPDRKKSRWAYFIVENRDCPRRSYNPWQPRQCMWVLQRVNPELMNYRTDQTAFAYINDNKQARGCWWHKVVGYRYNSAIERPRVKNSYATSGISKVCACRPRFVRAIKEAAEEDEEDKYTVTFVPGQGGDYDNESDLELEGGIWTDGDASDPDMDDDELESDEHDVDDSVD